MFKVIENVLNSKRYFILKKSTMTVLNDAPEPVGDGYPSELIEHLSGRAY